MKEVWNIVGYDTFEESYYRVPGSYLDERSTRLAAKLRLDLLNQTQPPDQTGGQNDEGIQDRIFIQRPNLTLYRYVPIPGEFDEKPKS
ncbi:MAG: hypothetical protein Q7S88_02410 [Candidatus Daviesbacteria bacterium]|nr:hypothetical protein [Candidatus Daviesbacteria bacterium]